MMNRTRTGVALLGFALASALLYGCTAHAQPTPTPSPVAAEVLTPRAAFPDNTAMQIRLKVEGQNTNVIKISDPSNIVTAKVTVQPGAQFPWHTHHGPVFVTVVQGELSYLDSHDCISRRYPSETAFVDAGQHVHTAYNSGKTVTVLMATYFEVPTGTAPLSIPAATPPNCKIPTN